MRIIPILIITFSINGCSWLGNKDTILPQDGPTMLDIYQGHFAGSSSGSGETDQTNSKYAIQKQLSVIGQRAIHSGTLDQTGVILSAGDQLNQRFTRLPNPTLMLYVYPHLAADNQYPVPGYFTSFSLYEVNYYALPGEAERQP